MQTALVDGKKVVASLIPHDEWMALSERQKSATKDNPVITTVFGKDTALYCKKSKIGLQFFALYPKHQLPPDYRYLQNESPEHAVKGLDCPHRAILWL